MDKSGVLEGTLSYVQAKYVPYLNSLQVYWSLLIFTHHTEFEWKQSGDEA